MNKQTSTSTFTQIRMGALFLNDVVQAIPENPVWDGDIAQYDGSSAITIQDAPSEMSPAWITWNVVAGMKRWTTQEDCDTLLVADRVLLTNVSWKDLAANGFAKGQVVTLNGRDFLCRLVPVGTADRRRCSGLSCFRFARNVEIGEKNCGTENLRDDRHSRKNENSKKQNRFSGCESAGGGTFNQRK